ncbi:MAG TPA: AAA family ATPase [Anaerolineae bacterium]|nr:AAA family ATPase [Anaerolineae bacterium]
MTQPFKITGLSFKNYRQFQSCHLDFTDSQGQPLDKICFIGANGTGKSTILELINQFLQQKTLRVDHDTNSLIAIRINTQSDESFFQLTNMGNNFIKSTAVELPEWQKLWERETNLTQLQDYRKRFRSYFVKSADIIDPLFQPNSQDLAIYAPPDGSSLLLPNKPVPNTSLNTAMPYFEHFPAYHNIAYQNTTDFWTILIYHIKKRESDFQQFLQQPATQSLSVAQARQQFDDQYPNILTDLAELWNFILEPAGLEFDIENAKIPVQLGENLEAYIRHITNKQTIPYNSLSSGIRNFIFRLGHIHSLYFNRDIQRGFLLIDEPEASLFPDLLYDIIDRYQAITQNTQLFVSTHSPIIAAQFRPEERFVLNFNDEGYVTAHRGIVPEGDDPNDILLQDFAVRNLYGRKGLEQWYRFLELKKEILETDSPTKKQSLIAEYAEIGRAYNFAPDEIPQ